LKKCCKNISRYFFLALFLGFFGSTTFFDHTHIYDGNVIVHSHPFKHGKDGKPMHSHNDSGYLLVYLLHNYIANIALNLSLASIILFLAGEITARTINNIPLKVRKSPFFLRGPPVRMPV
jgi:hypothetical protein